jgi:hypothetical protein
MEVILKSVRIAFCNVHSPKSSQSGLRYGAAFPIVPGSENHKAIRAALTKVATEKWDKKGPTILTALEKDRRVCFSESELTNKDGEVYDGFEGTYSFNAGQDSKKGKPLVIGPKKDPATGQFEILTEESGKPYSGCYVNVKVDIWAQDNPDPTIGRRINAQLKTVQFAKDGDAFGGGAPSNADGFEEVEGEFTKDELI